MNAYPVWVDGRFVEPFAPAVAAEDPGFSLGLAVFETLLFEDGCVYFVDEHLARFARGARELGIAWPPRFDVARAIDDYVAHFERLGARDCALRLTLTRGVPGRGESLVLAARDLLRAPEGGATAIVSRFAKLHGDPFERVKSTNRLRNVLAREEAFARGAFEALLPTEEGDLSEGTQSNLFVLSGGRLATPSVERGCLAGIVRELVLGDLEREPLAVPLAVGRVTPGDVERADEAFLTNTTGWVVPLVAVLGLRSGLPGGAGPVVREVRARIARLSARHRAERGRRTAAR